MGPGVSSLRIAGPHVGEEADVVADRQRLVARAASAKALSRREHLVEEAGLPVGVGEDEVETLRRAGQALAGRQRRIRRPRQSVQDPDDDVVLLEHDVDDLLDRHAGLFPVGRRVVGERLPQVLGDADVVDDEPARLVPEGAVDPGDRLHQPGALHRLVDVHRVHRRRVEARSATCRGRSRSRAGRRGPWPAP